jgi:ABC-type uncharacterized transport system ATPase subunit
VLVKKAWGNARNLQAGLHEVKAPKITINAESWRPTNMAAMQRYGIEVVPMSRVGHCVMMEDPQTFNRLMDEAVKKFIHTRALQEGQKSRVGLA